MTIPVLLGFVVLIAVLFWWYNHEVVIEGEATIHLQSEHEHFHFHTDLPPHMEIQPGDTLHILTLPDNLDAGRTEGAITYNSPVRLHKASWLQRKLTRSSSLLEVSELVDHP